MSSSPDYMQQLLGGLLQAPQQSSVTSGLLSGSDPTTQLGLSLLANSSQPGKFGAIFGKSALDAQQLQQQNALQRLQIAQGAVGLGASLQKQQAIMDYMKGAQNPTPAGPTAGGAPSAQAAVAQTPGAQPFMPGVSQMPADGSQPPPQMATGSQPQATAQTAQQPQQVAGSSTDISQIPIDGIPAQTYKRLAILMGKDPLTVEKETYERQLQIAQAQAKPQLSALDTVVKSDKPTQYVGADPQLHAIWNQTAPTLGYNPLKDFNDQNVRTVMNSARNKIASGVQLGDEAPIVPEQTIPGALGSIYQKNPLTGKLTQVKGEEPLKDVIDPNTGQPTNVRASAAEGKQPFNQGLYGAANVTDQALQFAADTYRTTGKFPSAFGKSPALQAKVLDKVASDAAASGDTAGSIAARQGALKANGQALDLNTKKLAVIEPATKKLDLDLKNLLDEANRVGGSQSPLVNRGIRAWQQGVTGDKDVAKLVVYLNTVEGEYAKINSGGTGAAAPSEGVRKEARGVINKYMSSGTLDSVADAMRQDGQNALTVLRDEKTQLSGAMGANAPGGNKQPLTHPGQSQSMGGFTVTRIN